MFRKFTLTCLTLTALCFGAAGSSRADTVTFDFEDQAATFSAPPQSSRPGALTSLSATNSGLTVAITRPGSSFDVVANAGDQDGKAPEFGARSLDSFFDTDDTVFVGDFSMSLSSVSIDIGDYGTPNGDTDTLRLEAYSGLGGTGSLLGLTTATLVNQPSGFSFLTLSVTASGINSIRFVGGSARFPNSAFYDNLTATFTPEVNPIPEPATLVLLGTGLAGIASKVRRRRKACRGGEEE